MVKATVEMLEVPTVGNQGCTNTIKGRILN